MSELKEKLTKEVSEIDHIISNPDEKSKVLNVIQEMIGDFTKHIVHLTERQKDMEDKMDEIYEMLSDIEEELISCLDEEIQAECPYCGELIPLNLKEEDFSDFECPNCHNMIEMERILEEHVCGCGCEDCDDCDDDCEEDFLDEDDFDGCDGSCGHCEGCSSEDEDEK